MFLYYVDFKLQAVKLYIHYTRVCVYKLCSYVASYIMLFTAYQGETDMPINNWKQGKVNRRGTYFCIT